MSDEVKIGNLTYVSSKRAAQISGYSQDYIGQLCRAGLTEAERIGGLWYITLDSLYRHKQKADSYVPTAPRKGLSVEAESLVAFDGKDYISTSRASEITGYHKDYIGQLARDGAILSKQVGNRWFVERESILSHKKAKDALLGAVQSESVGLSRHEAKEVEYPESLNNLSYSGAGPFLKYTSDDGDFFPLITETKADDKSSNIALGVERDLSRHHLVNPRTQNVDIENSEANPVPIRILRSYPHNHGSSLKSAQTSRRSLRRAQAGALASGIVTVIIFLALGFTYFGQNATYAANFGPARGKMTALAINASEILNNLGMYLERYLVPELVYKRVP
ncbi:MAG: hypothetical protein Q8R25_00395 [bacterium]|nr:hypothetical protein [bacterium]